VTHNVSLDSHELFSQLCVVTNLVKVGPRREVFLSCVNVADGVIRIWREWLNARAKESRSKNPKSSQLLHEANVVEETEGSAHAELESGDNNGSDACVLWVDKSQNVGIRVMVSEKKWRRDAPLLIHKDEDLAVSFSMQYEELFVRTAHLLFAVERSLLEQSNVSGKAMIFGSFATRNTE